MAAARRAPFGEPDKEGMMRAARTAFGAGLGVGIMFKLMRLRGAAQRAARERRRDERAEGVFNAALDAVREQFAPPPKPPRRVRIQRTARSTLGRLGRLGRAALRLLR